MMLLGILGTNMILLFSLRFLVNKASVIKTSGHFNKFSVISCSFLGFNRRIISTLQRNRVCDYFFLSSLLLRFIVVGCRSIPLIRIGGELNDYHE